MTYQIGNIKLSVGGNPLQMQLKVPAESVKLQRMLPVFQQVTNTFVAVGIKSAEAGAGEISCRQGCGACCRQPVPLAEVEAFAIAKLVRNLPKSRRARIGQRFAAAYEHFESIGWFERLSACGDDEELKKLALEYFHEGVACPFLEDESCSIHTSRPLACREYLVTSPAENCARPSMEAVEMIEIPVKISNIIRRIGHVRKNGNTNFVPLVQALNWAENHSDDFPVKKGEQWMVDFLNALIGGKVPAEA